LLLTRQDLPVLDQEAVEAGAARGGYVLAEAQGGPPELVLVGSGSEVGPLLEAAESLRAEGRRVRVVSLPCLERFQAQDAGYRESVLPADAPRLVVEAAVPLSAAAIVRPGDRFHGMDRFGTSAPYRVLAEEFGFTGAHLTELARELIA
jgi:transketolase